MSFGIEPKPYDGRRWSAVYINTIYICIRKGSIRQVSSSIHIIVVINIITYYNDIYIIIVLRRNDGSLVTECMAPSPEMLPISEQLHAVRLASTVVYTGWCIKTTIFFT